MRNNIILLIVSFPLWLPLVMLAILLLMKAPARKLAVSISVISMLDVAGLAFLKIFADWPDKDKALTLFWLPVAVYIFIGLFCMWHSYNADRKPI